MVRREEGREPLVVSAIAFVRGTHFQDALDEPADQSAPPPHVALVPSATVGAGDASVSSDAAAADLFSAVFVFCCEFFAAVFLFVLCYGKL